MITIIATRDLCGILGDVLPFTTPVDLPRLHSVRIHWDAHALHAQATDMYRIAWSTWSPDDPAADDTQPDLFTEWGGADDPWAIVIPLSDARDLVTVFKLPAKEWAVPLTVDCFDGRITVKRARETGHSALTAAINALSLESGVGPSYPDLDERLAKVEVNAEPADTTAYTAKLLADFARVRPHGPLQLTFAGKTTLVTIGSRFQGAIVPATIPEG